MKTTSKLLAATLALTLLGAAPVFADDSTIVRIVHPNGQSTYVAAPRDLHSPTVGVYAGERSFGSNREVVRTDADTFNGRVDLPVHNGRGQTGWVRVDR